MVSVDARRGRRRARLARRLSAAARGQRRSSCASRSSATTSPGSIDAPEGPAGQELRAAAAGAQSSRASTPEAVGRVREQVHGGAAPRDHRSRQHRQPAPGGARRSPATPTGGRPTARSTSVPTMTRRRPARPTPSRVLARDNLKVAAVGDIDAATLGKVLDARSARCRRPAAGRNAARARCRPPARRIVVAARRAAGGDPDGRRPGVLRKDPDFIPAYRGQPHPRRRLVLVAALRARCARSAASPMACPPICCTLRHSPLFMGSTQTCADEHPRGAGADRARRSRQMVRTDGADRATSWPRPSRYLKGSLRADFRHLEQDRRDASADPASTMLGIDYIHKRNGH